MRSSTTSGTCPSQKVLAAGYPLLVSGSRSGLLGVWSIHHGQLLQSLAADPGLETPAVKAKKGGDIFQI